MKQHYHQFMKYGYDPIAQKEIWCCKSCNEWKYVNPLGTSDHGG